MVSLQDIQGDLVQEQEEQNRIATRKRVVKLFIVCAVCIVVRLIVKDPAPQKAAVHPNKPIKALPGMLQNIPLSEQQKMSPDVIAKLHQADLDVMSPTQLIELALMKKSYKPFDAPLRNLTDEELAREYKFTYAKRQKAIEHVKEKEIKDPSKIMVVHLLNGRYLIAERTNDKNKFVSIQVDRTMVANLPKSMIRSISDNAHSWKEPIPKGQALLKPAKGVSIVVNEETAKRITINKINQDAS